VAHDGEPVLAEMVRQAEHVRGQLVEVIGRNARGLAAGAIAALVRRDHVEAGLGQRGE